MKVWMAGALGFLLVGGMALAQEPVPVGQEFQVNTYTTSYQRNPDIAVDRDGDFVVMWGSNGSYGTDSSSYSVQGQRYDSAGTPMGGEFQVNTYTTNGQLFPSVAVATDGDLVVVWQSQGSPGNDSQKTSVQAQRYDATGAPVGGQFQVNTFTTDYQFSPSVAVGGGDFMVVWASYGSNDSDLSSSSIQAQRYDSAGTTMGGQFQVNTYTTLGQFSPAVAANPQGGFVVVWASYGSNDTDSSSYSVQAQRYDANGTPVGGEFQVNTYTTADQRNPEVAVDADGDFVVVWQSFGSNGSDSFYTSVQGQRYDAGGSPVGGEFQVNTYTTFNQYNPLIAADVDGDFVVVWTSYGSYGNDSSSNSVQGQRYDGGGNPVGSQFQVNTHTTSSQRYSSVGADPSGDFVVVWQSRVGDSDTSVQGQRYSTPIFTDGFESGDMSTWSSTVQ